MMVATLTVVAQNPRDKANFKAHEDRTLRIEQHHDYTGQRMEVNQTE